MDRFSAEELTEIKLLEQLGPVSEEAALQRILALAMAFAGANGSKKAARMFQKIVEELTW